jgi:hypothetical protein
VGVEMKFDDILVAINTKKERTGRPFRNFNNSIQELLNAIEYIKSNANLPITDLLTRSIVITAVTAVEVFYKDTLDQIFRVCDPVYYKPILKEIHKDKYDIDDLILFYEKGIHPLELISINQSFQNIEVIEAIFSKFLQKKLFKTVLELQVRLSEEQDNIVTFSDKLINSMNSLFKLRHELVHGPGKKMKYDLDILFDLITDTQLFVFGTEIIIINNMNNHIDKNIQLTNNIS